MLLTNTIQAQAEPEPPPSAASPEYVRWLQSTLNRAIGGTLPVDGAMSAAVRDAILKTRALSADTEKQLRDAITAFQPLFKKP